MFFTTYPEKVWGVSTKKLDANWAPKRVEIRDIVKKKKDNTFANEHENTSFIDAKNNEY